MYVSSESETGVARRVSEGKSGCCSSEEEFKGDERVERVWGGIERNGMDVENGMEQGRTSGAGSNDGDAWHTDGTDDGACLTLAVDNSPHNSPQESFLARSPDTSLGNERSTGRASTHSIWGTRTLRGGVVEDTTTCHRPHSLPTSPDSHPQQKHHPNPLRHFIHASTTTRHDTPVSSPVPSSKRIDPSHDV